MSLCLVHVIVRGGEAAYEKTSEQDSAIEMGIAHDGDIRIGGLRGGWTRHGSLMVGIYITTRFHHTYGRTQQRLFPNPYLLAHGVMLIPRIDNNVLVPVQGHWR